MANIFSFCKTVRGHSHVTHDRPCDDHSLAFYDETADCTIAAVSDGHGSPAYARSRFRSDQRSPEKHKKRKVSRVYSIRNWSGLNWSAFSAASSSFVR